VEIENKDWQGSQQKLLTLILETPKEKEKEKYYLLIN
jgi:hypothetical protein